MEQYQSESLFKKFDLKSVNEQNPQVPNECGQKVQESMLYRRFESTTSSDPCYSGNSDFPPTTPDGISIHPSSPESPHRSYRFGHRAKRSHGRRLISKTSGSCKVCLLNVTDKHKRFTQDFFNTLIECRWRFTLLVFFLGNFVSWFLFALLWYLMAAAHGDLLVQRNTDASLQHVPCVVNMIDFASCFLYSMESQTTIGYGTTYPSRECPEAIFLLCCQSIMGMIIQAFTVGVVFSKLTRPTLRTQTLVFSRNAVVALKDGFLTLQFRVADIRKSPVVNAVLSAQLVRSRVTPEGEYIELNRSNLKLNVDGSGSRVYLVLPVTAEHRIDCNSPLFTESPNDILHSDFEIVVFLEGCIQATGQIVQARTSYLNSDIMWGHRLYPIIKFNKHRRRYEADFSRFDDSLEIDTPLCAAKDIEAYRAKVYV